MGTMCMRWQGGPTAVRQRGNACSLSGAICMGCEAAESMPLDAGAGRRELFLWSVDGVGISSVDCSSMFDCGLDLRGFGMSRISCICIFCISYTTCTSCMATRGLRFNLLMHGYAVHSRGHTAPGKEFHRKRKDI